MRKKLDFFIFFSKRAGGGGRHGANEKNDDFVNPLSLFVSFSLSLNEAT